jgi:hypothetical protein
MDVKVTSPGLQALVDMHELASDPADMWGTNSEWLIAVAETLIHADVDVPVEWRFTAVPHDGWEPEGYVEEVVGDMLMDGMVTVDDLLVFGEALRVQGDQLESAGLAY